MKKESSSTDTPLSRDERVGKAAEKAKKKAIKKALKKGKSQEEAEKIGKEVADGIFGQVLSTLKDPKLPPTLSE
jgi:hypothetical protein